MQRAGVSKCLTRSVPTAETVPRDGQRNMIYDELGIDFQVFVDGRVNELRIFKPRAARSIWRF